MKFFRVKPEFDQARRKDGSILIGNELYTAAEKARFAIPEKALETMEISRNKTFWSFGTRFAIMEA